MIVYFSSTGNSKHAAERIADALGDRAASMLDVGKISLAKGESLGFVFPTYFWRLPSVVDGFMKGVDITFEGENPYIYFVATYGSTCGGSAFYMKRHLRKKGLRLSASFGIKTVDDWTVWFDLSDSRVVEEVLAREGVQIEEIIRCLKAKTLGNRMKNTLPMAAVVGSNVFYSLARRTKHLNVNENCIGCGLCARECPTKSIEITDGRPRWVKDKCTMCLHCLHACPKFAVNYDGKTQSHGQYNHP